MPVALPRGVGLLLGLAVALLSGPAWSLTIGSPDPSSGNRFPFGSVGSFPSDRYQQVYAASAFDGPTYITALQFAQTQLPGGALNQGAFSISLSVTSKEVNGLDLVDLDANVGSAPALFAQIDALDDARDGAALKLVGAAFYYDPLAGNLLVDVQITDSSHFGPLAFFDAMNGSAEGLFSSAHNFSSSAAGIFDNTGLVTTFVPEPSSGLMLAGGLIGLCLRARRRIS